MPRLKNLVRFWGKNHVKIAKFQSRTSNFLHPWFFTKICLSMTLISCDQTHLRQERGDRKPFLIHSTHSALWEQGTGIHLERNYVCLCVRCDSGDWFRNNEKTSDERGIDNSACIVFSVWWLFLCKTQGKYTFDSIVSDNFFLSHSPSILYVTAAISFAFVVITANV